jgi:hypothetical protein
MLTLRPYAIALLPLFLIDHGAQSEQQLPLAISVEASRPRANAQDVAPTPDGIAAKAWAIIDGKTCKLLWGFHDYRSPWHLCVVAGWTPTRTSQPLRALRRTFEP